MTPDEKPPDYLGSRKGQEQVTKKTPRRLWLKAALGLGAAGASVGVYARWWETDWLVVSRHSLPPDKFRVEKPLRFLHLSDFHASEVVPFELIEKAIDLGLAEKPNAVFLTGDFITSKLSEQEFDRFAEILGKFKIANIPAFACLGNHDGGKWAIRTYGYETSEKVEVTLKKAGVFLLRNQRENIFINEQKITIAGVGDLWSGEMQPAHALKRKTNQPNGQRPPILLLSHNPDSKEELAPYDWDLMLCGHTHGGQCVLPWIGTPFAPVKDHRFVEGLHEWKNRLIHVTRGVGNLHGLRFNCRPEVSLLEVSPATLGE